MVVFFFFNDTATTEIYTLSLHDALPISYETCALGSWNGARARCCADGGADARQRRRRFRRTAAVCDRSRHPGAAARLLPTQARILLPAPAVRGAAPLCGSASASPSPLLLP